ncbi:ATP-binding protein [Thalassospira xiamenensis]|uniref:AAA domain-containing protein, putative AbiEii toxin, Type IV TA system n=1 Tax=Thalassospira xiamenensis TaxID=220697 RepID=A0A285TVK8_9PROT|nr:ATP-binding protein [Thalassospira xiamenensis]SOC28126.1 AAA domain-containing protein, putative AbiEii toxin, Type IV TA system [Thalassospira xiamenensis]
MKIVYAARDAGRSNAPSKLGENVIELLKDRWDDYSCETLFKTSCNINGEEIYLGSIRIQIKDKTITWKHLDALIADGWNGEFPIPDTEYISVPSEITFYQQLSSSLSIADAIDIAERLRDASYLVRIKVDQSALNLTKSRVFNDSLQRSRGSVKSFLDGWLVFKSKDIEVSNLGFKFHAYNNELKDITFKFEETSILPHEINVVIGSNGSGKSQLLHQIVKAWLGENQKTNEKYSFHEPPNISQVVVVSYSPFEMFPVDLFGLHNSDENIYKYFGMRERSVSQKPGALSRNIRLTHQAPKKSSVISLLNCLEDDSKYGTISEWSNKTSTVEEVISTAFDFDFAAVNIPNTCQIDDVELHSYHKEAMFDVEISGEKKRFVRISKNTTDELNLIKLREHTIKSDGVTFFKNGKPVELSSGQKLFSYIVVNVLGAIRRNSLLLIDEPELFLHPNLEIQFIDMLKQILSSFSSKAIIATHSLVTVREIPKNCVHVFTRTDDGLEINNPPFQTFSGDIQRISSYVFGDKSISKPYKHWIKKQIKNNSDIDSLLEQLKGELNEELIIQLEAERGD